MSCKETHKDFPRRQFLLVKLLLLVYTFSPVLWTVFASDPGSDYPLRV